MRWQLDLRRIARSPSIVNLTARTIFTRIIRRTIRFPSCICRSAATADVSIVDYNRSGVPLIEIVSEPDMRSAEEVIAYLEKLRLIIQYLGASDCKLNEGSMRADVNLSVREAGAAEFGTRTEMKNLNSFKAIARAIEGERARQIELIEEGKKVVQETRRWDDNKESSHAMRSKEDAQDYRYFPEPDLVPVVISDEWIERVKARQPEMRDEKLIRYQEEFGLPKYDAEILTGDKSFADLFEAAAAICGKPKKVFKEDIDPEAYVKEKGLLTVNDEGALRETVAKVIAENPQSVEDYHNGKEKAIGFLVGQTMKAMKGKANPALVNQILKELL